VVTPIEERPPERVALIITDLEPGGAERSLVELAKRLDRQRFLPSVYCLAGPPQGQRTGLVEELASAGVGVTFLGGRTVWQVPKVLLRLVRALRRDRPRIVQTFLFHANLLGSLAARLAGVPRVATGIRVAERAQRWHLWLARAVQVLADWHVCVSRGVAEFSASRGRLPPKKLVVIPNGVDCQRFADVAPLPLRELGMSEGRRAILFIGRLEPQKGPVWLLELAPRLLGALAGHDLVFVGHGPQQAELQQLSRRLGIAQRVHFVGWRSDVPAILAASDMLVLPSVWEGMPNVLLEAMAAGKPVMATDVEGVREMLGDLVEEQSASQDQPELFLHKLLRICRNPVLQQRLGNQNLQRVQDFFGYDAMVLAYQQLYETMLEAR